MSFMRPRIVVALAASVLLALGLTSNALASGSSTSQAAPKCGLGTGKKATGAPIKLGGIFTLVPGVDFTTIGKIANAYFKCVNDNGGIRGRRISYKIYTEQLKPEQEAALARKLVESDKVVGIVGNTSLIECGVNHAYYRQQKYNLIIAGVPADCFGRPNIAAVNMGPRYSVIGAAQALVRAGCKGTMVISSPDVVEEYANGGAILVANQAGIKPVSYGETLPITDPASLIQKYVQAAGSGGCIILDFTPESAAPLMQAAKALGVADDYLWGSSTPIADEASAKVGSPDFDGKMLINSEFGLLSDRGPDMQLYRAITRRYEPNVSIQSFGQMGFLVGKFTTAALLSIRGEVTKESYNKAVKNLKNQKSDILCKPWYFGNLPLHIPNNWDITVTYKNGIVVRKEACFPIAAVDPQLAKTRAWEKQFKLNVG
jgi:branched-chain amino acid transport system substrate-binding protein